MRVVSVFIFLFRLGICLTLLGAFIASKELLAIGTIVAGLNYALRDYFSNRIDNLNIMSFYAGFSGIWFGVGNLAGYLAEDGPYDHLFFDYADRTSLFETQLLGTLAVLVPVFTYEFLRKRKQLSLALKLPQIGFDATMGQRMLFYSIIFLLGICYLERYFQTPLTSIGTFTAFIQMVPYLTIFSLIYLRLSNGLNKQPRWSNGLFFFLVAYEFLNSLMFSNMRSKIFLPIVVIFLAYIVNKKIKVKHLILGIPLLFALVFIFKQVGEMRGLTGVYGGTRLANISEQFSALLNKDSSDASESMDPFGIMGVLARLSTFNQMSAAMRIAEEDGFYNGATLNYLLYAFIPRMIWPEKPQIAPAQWFAMRLGRGMWLTETRFSNAVNITIPGELYLNFGWVGVCIGLSVLAILYFVLWEAAGFYRLGFNLVGMAFSFILLNQTFMGGGHMGAMVSLIFWYVFFYAVTCAYMVLHKPRIIVRHPNGYANLEKT